MIHVSVKGLNETMKKLKGLQQHITDSALISVLNKTATQGRNYSVRKIRQTYTISSGDLKEKITIEKASKKRLEAKIVAKRERRPMNVIRFSARMTSKGVSVKVKKTGGRYLWRNAFIANINGNELVVKRTGKFTIPTKGRYAGKIKTRNTKRGAKGEHIQREQLQTILGPSIADIFGEKNMYNDLRKWTNEKLVEVFMKELEYYTRKHFNR